MLTELSFCINPVLPFRILVTESLSLVVTAVPACGSRLPSPPLGAQLTTVQVKSLHNRVARCTSQ